MSCPIFVGSSPPEPEKYYQDPGLANDLDPKKGILSPFYLPKIGEPTEFESFQLGGSIVFLATPARVFSEENKPLDRDLAMQGHLVELAALNRVRFGQIFNKKKCDKYCQLHGIKPIACRWVLGSKEVDNKGREHRIYACGFAAWHPRRYWLPADVSATSIQSFEWALVRI